MDHGSIIKNGCKIIGPVIIGKNCVIEANTTIGPNTSLMTSIRVNRKLVNQIVILYYSKSYIKLQYIFLITSE